MTTCNKTFYENRSKKSWIVLLQYVKLKRSSIAKVLMVDPDSVTAFEVTNHVEMSGTLLRRTLSNSIIEVGDPDGVKKICKWRRYGT